MKNKLTFLSILVPLMLSGCGGGGGASSSTSSQGASSDVSSDTSSTSTSTSSSETPTPGKDWNTNAGRFIFNDSGILSAQVNSICTKKEETLRKGTIEATVQQNTANDAGLVFLCSHEEAKFWEDSSTSYYFFFVSRSGSAYLGKTDRDNWTACSVMDIVGWSLSSSYKLSVSFDTTKEDCDIISCFIDDQFMFTYRDYNRLPGGEFGLRAGNSNVNFSYPTTSLEVKEEEKKVVEGYVVGNGDAIYSGNKLMAVTNNVILYKPEDKVENGSFTMRLYQSGEPSDSGMIFSLVRNDSVHFWEAGVSYYFFFIDQGGNTRLSKVVNGSWVDLVVGPQCPDYSYVRNTFHTLIVERDNSRILCYVNGIPVIDFNDESPLIGDGFAIRLGKQRAAADNISIQETGKFVYGEPTDYNVISGGAIAFNSSSFTTTKINNLLLHKTLTFTTGKLTMGIVPATNMQCGLVFKSDAEGKSYYLLYVEGGAGGSVGISKIENGVATPMENKKFLSAGYRPGNRENFEVVIDGNKIMCFMRGIMYFAIEDNEMLTGNNFGLFSLTSNASGFLPTVDASYEFQGVDTLITGHSYMELWANYKTDLSKYTEIHNIGIGGSTSVHWTTLIKSVIEYKPTKLIYCIGINDINIGYDTSSIFNNISTFVSQVHNALPSTKICLVSTNQCPYSAGKKNEIIALNSATKQLVNDNSSYMVYADMDNAFLDASGNPRNECFTDTLHPTAESYLTFRDAIYTAFGD